MAVCLREGVGHINEHELAMLAAHLMGTSVGDYPRRIRYDRHPSKQLGEQCSDYGESAGHFFSRKARPREEQAEEEVYMRRCPKTTAAALHGFLLKRCKWHRQASLCSFFFFFFFCARLTRRWITVQKTSAGRCATISGGPVAFPERTVRLLGCYALRVRRSLRGGLRRAGRQDRHRLCQTEM